MNQQHSQAYDNIVVWTALITPFDLQGEIDFDALISLAQQQAHAGNGILLLGSTGEALALTLSQQREIVKTVTDLALSVPIMVGVGGCQLEQQQAWIRECNSLPIDALLLAAPLYAKPGPQGQKQWFSALLDTSEHPCMLYNVPSRSGVTLSAQTLASLQHHSQCWALKEASGDIEQFLAYREACPNIRLFSGEDGLMPYLSTAGAVGLVSVAANVWPAQTQLYAQQCLAGINRDIFPTWKNAVSSLFVAANPIPVKVLMHDKGMINAPLLKLPLTHEELTDCQAQQAADDQINAWFQAQTFIDSTVKQARA